MKVRDETSVTRHVTRGRLKKLKLINGVDWATALEMCRGDERLAARYLDALCLAWFGAFGPVAPRSDRGGIHAVSEYGYRTFCQNCDGEFYPVRPDAQFCSDRCRQAAYRARKAAP